MCSVKGACKDIVQASDGRVEARTRVSVPPPTLAMCVAFHNRTGGPYLLLHDLPEVGPRLGLALGHVGKVNDETARSVSWAFVDLFSSNVGEDSLGVARITSDQ